MTTYIFFREGMFYPIDLKDDEDARQNARVNPGTLRVETLGGTVVWRCDADKAAICGRAAS